MAGAEYALQDDEIAALSSIYPGHVDIESVDSVKGCHIIGLSIPVDLPSATPTVLTSVAQSPTSTSAAASLEIAHLPSLSARVLLPSGYPSNTPPRIVSLRARIPKHDGPGGWLSNRMLSKVQERLAAMWTSEQEAAGEGVGVLWAWFDWVSSSQFLHDLGLVSNGILRLPTPPALTTSMYLLLLKANDAAATRSDFEGAAHPCAICFGDRKGRSCVQLPACGCVFCHSCLHGFWALAIQEGSLTNVACPSVDCVKARAARPVEHAAAVFDDKRSDGITAAVVESVVGKELVKRWHTLSAKRLIETDPLYTFCPHERCQAPVPPPTDPEPREVQQAEAVRKVIRLDIGKSEVPSSKSSSHEDTLSVASRWDNFRQCPRCEMAFCILCRATWHGVHAGCSIKDAEKAVREYLDADEEQREAIRARLGPRNTDALMALVRDHELHQLLQEWAKANASACPGCKSIIEKSEGCNHMTCDHCRTHFCYRCGAAVGLSIIEQCR
ncbi:hypothetical protein VHUM_02239 [Vanrija humicola]|uniref:RBR-type E3 ubiquitin transferase n=1 Tax=Vanrija humicola TaxID=5417 RepID=A0A7D8V1J6_VANHU|nr:hypothetical protein VHUM_02239 [Vanrija humicola]